MLRTSLRLLPFCTVALALAAGCSTTTTTDGGGGTTGGSSTGGGTTTGGGSTSGGSTTGGSTSGGSSSGGTSGGVDAGCGPSHFHCPPATPLCDTSDGGACVQCLANTDCHAAKPICIQDDTTPLAGFYVHKCAQCQTSADCVSTGNTRGPICDTSGQATSQGTEYTCGPNCLDGGVCSDPLRQVCAITGLCVGCQSNADCQDPIKNQCDRVNGSCIQCFNDGDCTGASDTFGPTPYCYKNQTGLPSAIGETCVNCVDAGQCATNGFGATNACNTFDNRCERSCGLFLDCTDPFIGVCTSFSDANADPVCGCDPTKSSPVNGCSGPENSCVQIFMGPPKVGACACITATGADVCPSGTICDYWAAPFGVCTPPCTTNADCPNPHRPYCDQSAHGPTNPIGGICVGCLPDGDAGCGATDTCDPVSNVCRASCASTSCPADQPLCNTMTGLCQQCQLPFSNTPPPPVSGCPKDKICSGFVTSAAGTVSPLECQ